MSDNTIRLEGWDAARGMFLYSCYGIGFYYPTAGTIYFSPELIERCRQTREAINYDAKGKV